MKKEYSMKRRVGIGIRHKNQMGGKKMEYETFYDEIKALNGVLRVTIPDKLVKFAGFKVGDKVKVMIKKE